MVLGEAEIKKLIVAKKDGAFGSVLGPSVIGRERIWEVWVTKAGVYYNRYVVEQREGDPIYFETFQKLALHLEESRAPNIREQADVHLKKFAAYVAGVTFIATVGAMLYLLVTGHGDTPTTIVVGLLGVIASGSALFFGRWIPFPA
jgi:hypothetical protein